MANIGMTELLLLVVTVMPVVAVLAVVLAVRYSKREAERRYGPLDPRQRHDQS